MTSNYYLPATEVLTNKGFVQIQHLNRNNYDIGLVDSSGILFFKPFNHDSLSHIKYAGEMVSIICEDYNLIVHPGTQLVQRDILSLNNKYDFKNVNVLDLDTTLINNILVNYINNKEGTLNKLTVDHLVLIDKFIKDTQDLSWIYDLDISSTFATDFINILAKLLEEEADEFANLLHLGLSKVNADALQYICCISGNFSSYTTLYDDGTDSLYLIKILNNSYPISVYNLNVNTTSAITSILYSLETENQMIIIRQNGSLLLSNGS